MLSSVSLSCILVAWMWRPVVQFKQRGPTEGQQRDTGPCIPGRSWSLPVSLLKAVCLIFFWGGGRAHNNTGFIQLVYIFFCLLQQNLLLPDNTANTHDNTWQAGFCLYQRNFQHSQSYNRGLGRTKHLCIVPNTSQGGKSVITSTEESQNTIGCSWKNHQICYQSLLLSSHIWHLYIYIYIYPTILYNRSLFSQCYVLLKSAITILHAWLYFCVFK